MAARKANDPRIEMIGPDSKGIVSQSTRHLKRKQAEANQKTGSTFAQSFKTMMSFGDNQDIVDENNKLLE